MGNRRHQRNPIYHSQAGQHHCQVHSTTPGALQRGSWGQHRSLSTEEGSRAVSKWQPRKKSGCYLSHSQYQIPLIILKKIFTVQQFGSHCLELINAMKSWFLWSVLRLAEDCLGDGWGEGRGGEGVGRRLWDGQALEFCNICTLYKGNQYFSH